MRLIAAVVSAGIVALVVGGLSTSAQAAPRINASAQASWTYIDSYWSNKACVDAGQQYEREGWNEYKCVDYPLSSPSYELYIR
ncbi:hypothetical protein [Actinoallomurus acaciae]|uniref:Secreted protein n=1 Tax=Actinoallomurus acaciae TaxID=502577 RepID=A0ABV5YHG1_9ACTN